MALEMQPSDWKNLGLASWMMTLHVREEGGTLGGAERSQTVSEDFLELLAQLRANAAEWVTKPLLHGAQKLLSWVPLEYLTYRIIRGVFFFFVYIVLFWYHLKLREKLQIQYKEIVFVSFESQVANLPHNLEYFMNS